MTFSVCATSGDTTHCDGNVVRFLNKRTFEEDLRNGLEITEKIRRNRTLKDHSVIRNGKSNTSDISVVRVGGADADQSQVFINIRFPAFSYDNVDPWDGFTLSYGKYALL